MTGRQRNELPALVKEEWTAEDKQRAGACLDDRREGGIEFAFTCRFHDQDLPPDGAACRLCRSHLKLVFRLVRVYQHGDDGRLGK